MKTNRIVPTVVVFVIAIAGDNDNDRFVIRSFVSLAKAEAWNGVRNGCPYLKTIYLLDSD